MALSVAIFVGEARNWIPEFVEKAKKLSVTAGWEPGCDIAPLTYKALHERVTKLIGTCEPEGA